MIFHYDVVATFDSIDNAQIDMICYPNEIASFDSMPGNQNDFFLSLLYELVLIEYLFLFLLSRRNGRQFSSLLKEEEEASLPPCGVFRCKSEI